MFMRCFVAIDLPREEKMKIFGLQKRFMRFSGIRPLYADFLHMTLEFLGDIETHSIPGVKNALLRSASGAGSILCRGQKICVLPSKEFFRVICIGLEPTSALCGLHARLSSNIREELGKDAGLHERDFFPHITFARVKNGGEKEKILAEITDANNELPGISFVAREIALKESVLGPWGAKYNTLEKVVLA